MLAPGQEILELPTAVAVQQGRGGPRKVLYRRLHSLRILCSLKATTAADERKSGKQMDQAQLKSRAEQSRAGFLVPADVRAELGQPVGLVAANVSLSLLRIALAGCLMIWGSCQRAVPGLDR